jgi:hypothetical protein
MKIFEVIAEDKKTWMKDGVEMCSKDCCGQPVTECECGPECKHCDCYKVNEGYGIRQGTAMARNQTSASINSNKRANNSARNNADEINISSRRQQRKIDRNAKVQPTGIPIRAVAPPEAGV